MNTQNTAVVRPSILAAVLANTVKEVVTGNDCTGAVITGALVDSIEAGPSHFVNVSPNGETLLGRTLVSTARLPFIHVIDGNQYRFECVTGALTFMAADRAKVTAEEMSQLQRTYGAAGKHLSQALKDEGKLSLLKDYFLQQSQLVFSQFAQARARWVDLALVSDNSKSADQKSEFDFLDKLFNELAANENRLVVYKLEEGVMTEPVRGMESFTSVILPAAINPIRNSLLQPEQQHAPDYSSVIALQQKSAAQKERFTTIGDQVNMKEKSKNDRAAANTIKSWERRKKY